jgi:hypothetical protein
LLPAPFLRLRRDALGDFSRGSSKTYYCFMHLGRGISN